jgi:hypothetical protein
MLGRHDGDFGKRPQHGTNLRHEPRRFVKGDGVRHGGAHPQCTFVQLGHELRADHRHEDHRQHEQRRRSADDQARARHAPFEPTCVAILKPSKGAILPFGAAAFQQHGAQYRNDRERHEQGADQGEDRGVGHRREQAARGPGEHVDREKRRDDDANRVDDRAVDLRRGRRDGVADGALLRATHGELSIDVLHHDDGPIDENAEVDGADREEVRRNVPDVQTDEREQQRQRNRRRDDEPRPHVVEEEDQHDDHQQDAVQQVGLDGVRGEPDEIAAIVERPHLHVGRQDAGVELPRLGFDALEHRLRLLAGAHQDDALHRVVDRHEAELSQPGRMADHDLRDVLHEDRRAVLHGEDDVADVVERIDAPEPAHVIELPALGEKSASRVPIVRAERGGDGRRGQSRSGELGRIEQDLVLHRLAAERREVRDAGDRPELLVQHPVLENLELHRGTIGAFEHVAIHEARRRRERRDRWRDAAGQSEIADPLERLLTCEIIVCPVLEGEPDVREPVQRDRSRHLESG